jgi:hypothetical protein
MLQGFYRRFGGFVWEGTKTHTIRDHRKDRPPRPGELFYCFIDSQQPTMTRLGNFPVLKVDPIAIAPKLTIEPEIVIAGELLDEREADLFAWRDGFRVRRGPYRFNGAENLELFANYRFGQTKKKRAAARPFDGTLTHWTFDATPIGPKDKTPGRAPLPSVYAFICPTCGKLGRRSNERDPRLENFCISCGADLRPFRVELVLQK